MREQFNKEINGQDTKYRGLSEKKCYLIIKQNKT